MKNIILSVLLLFSVFSFTQSNDSIPERKFQDIFGCSCCTDTIVQKSGIENEYECTLYRKALVLTGSKKGKVIWKIDLTEKLVGKDLTYLCIMDGRRDKRYNHLWVTTEGKMVMIVNARNGKEVK